MWYSHGSNFTESAQEVTAQNLRTNVMNCFIRAIFIHEFQNEVWFSVEKINFKMSSAKFREFCLGLSVNCFLFSCVAPPWRAFASGVYRTRSHIITLHYRPSYIYTYSLYISEIGAVVLKPIFPNSPRITYIYIYIWLSDWSICIECFLFVCLTYVCHLGASYPGGNSHYMIILQSS